MGRNSATIDSAQMVDTTSLFTAVVACCFSPWPLPSRLSTHRSYRSDNGALRPPLRRWLVLPKSNDSDEAVNEAFGLRRAYQATYVYVGCYRVSALLLQALTRCDGVTAAAGGLTSFAWFLVATTSMVRQSRVQANVSNCSSKPSRCPKKSLVPSMFFETEKGVRPGSGVRMRRQDSAGRRERGRRRPL